MAYINKEKAAKIREAIKKEFPRSQGWKFSISIENHSTLNCDILQAPVNFEKGKINHFWHKDHLKDKPEQLKIISRIIDIMNGATLPENERNFDKSDPMTDYFYVGWYIDLSIGKWNQEFIFVEPKEEKARPEPKKDIQPGKIQVIQYSQKAIVVTGDTFPIKDKLRELGGKFNKFLSCGPGWIFPAGKLTELQTSLSN